MIFTSDIYKKDIKELRTGFACYCRLLGVRKDTCTALTLLLSSEESLIAMMKFMSEIDASGVQKEMDTDDVTTMVVNLAREIREWQDRQDPQTLHFKFGL